MLERKGSSALWSIQPQMPSASCEPSNILPGAPAAGVLIAHNSTFRRPMFRKPRVDIACPQIETKGALDQLDDILSIEGVDMVCFGPNDLSAALTGRSGVVRYSVSSIFFS